MDLTTRPQFFSILFSEFNLYIPSAFLKHIADDNHGKATVNFLGKFWQVKLEEDQRGLYFGDGWQEFVEAHAFSEGYLLVFSYQGNMVFTLKVFDRTACKKNDLKKRKVFGDKDQGAVHCSKPAPKRYMSKKKLKQERSQSEEDVQFQRWIYPSHLVYGRITVPVAFCEPFGLTRSQEVIIRDPQQRSWPVKFLFNRRTPRLATGLSKFFVENNLAVGDRCVFKLASEKNTIDVEILKVQTP